jgi:hypothetical protein
VIFGATAVEVLVEVDVLVELVVVLYLATLLYDELVVALNARTRYQYVGPVKLESVNEVVETVATWVNVEPLLDRSTL